MVKILIKVHVLKSISFRNRFRFNLILIEKLPNVSDFKVLEQIILNVLLGEVFGVNTVVSAEFIQKLKALGVLE